jgi:hypothetical protein
MRLQKGQSLLAPLKKKPEFRMFYSSHGQLFSTVLTSASLSIHAAIEESLARLNQNHQLDLP